MQNIPQIDEYSELEHGALVASMLPKKPMMTRALRLLTTALLISLAACSSEGKIGESCEEPGKTDGECESGAVCGKETDNSQVCLQICNVQTDCGSDKDCNGVEGSSLKACRLKEKPLGTGGTK